jgi:hypothetical protein
MWDRWKEKKIPILGKRDKLIIPIFKITGFPAWGSKLDFKNFENHKEKLCF